MALDKRIIAIQMLPKAYDEIQRLKGEDTWTRFIIECVLAKVGDNSILKDELAGLIKEAEARKVKAEKPKAEKPKAKKVGKVQAKANIEGAKAEEAKVTEEREPTEAELKAIEAEAPSAKEAERVKLEGGKTLIMPHTHKDDREPTSGINTLAMRQKPKGKTLQEL